MSSSLKCVACIWWKITTRPEVHKFLRFIKTPNLLNQGKYMIAYVKCMLIHFFFEMENYFKLQWNVFYFYFGNHGIDKICMICLIIVHQWFNSYLNKDVLSLHFTHHINSFSGNWRLEIHSNGARSIFSLDLYSCLSSRNCWDYL